MSAVGLILVEMYLGPFACATLYKSGGNMRAKLNRLVIHAQKEGERERGEERERERERESQSQNTNVM